LHDQLAAVVEDDVELVLLSRETRVGNFAWLEAAFPEMRLKRGRLLIGELAGV